MKRKRTIEDEAGFVTIHVALPPQLLKAAVKRAKSEAHGDLSAVVRNAIDCLMAKHKAELSA